MEAGAPEELAALAEAGGLEAVATEEAGAAVEPPQADKIITAVTMATAFLGKRSAFMAA